MIRRVVLGATVLCSAVAAAGCRPSEESAALSGPYFGMAFPGDTPTVFAPGIVSTDKRELNSIFTPDGSTFYFSVVEGDDDVTIMEMKHTSGSWTDPALASFSHPAGDVDPFVSPDGSKLFFGSKRPREGSNTPEPDWQIWMVERVGEDWGEPRMLGATVNSGPRQIYPTVTSDGALYFQSERDGTLGEADIFVSRLVDGEYTEAVNVGPPVSSEHAEGDVFVAPDESYLIFVSSDRPDGFGSGDLFITYRNEDGSWSDASNLGGTINTDQFDFCPVVSPDGRFFFYTSGGDVHWVDAGFIDRMRESVHEP